MKEPNGYISVDFTYTDEFENTTYVSKKVDSDYMGESELDIIGDLFHDFIMACGFTFLADKRVEWVEDNR